MPALAALLLAFAPPQESMKHLVERWKSPAEAERSSATESIVAQWSTWDETPLRLLEHACRNPDAELARRAGEAWGRVVLRRAAGDGILGRVPDLDRVLVGGSPDGRARKVRDLVGLWKSGQIEESRVRALCEALRGQELEDADWGVPTVVSIGLVRIPELMPEEDRHLFVLEGATVRPIPVDDAIEYWRKRLEKAR